MVICGARFQPPSVRDSAARVLVSGEVAECSHCAWHIMLYPRLWVRGHRGIICAMLNASHYHATETLPNGLRLLIRATEPHDDLAGAIQRKVSPQSFFYRFFRPKHYLTDKEVASFTNCDFVSQVGLIGLERCHNRKTPIVRLGSLRTRRSIWCRRAIGAAESIELQDLCYPIRVKAEQPRAQTDCAIAARCHETVISSAKTPAAWRCSLRSFAPHPC
jgi:hypothetical protein